MSSSHDSAYPQLDLGVQRDTPKKLAAARRLDEVEAAAAWRALAPLLAGRPIARESTNGGRAYPAKGTRALTDRLPPVPAAIPVYSKAGETRVLVIDLDTSRADRQTVLRDLAAVRVLVAQAGGRAISDESPSGGVHIYIPLSRPIPFHDSREFAQALAARLPTMDPQPMLGLTDGLIRPPGSRHRSGGYQQLHGTLAEAYDIARRPNDETVWAQLRTVLAAEIAAVRAQRAEHARQADTPLEDVPFEPRKGGARDLAPDFLRIATTGLFDTTRYPSPSHARQAVLTSAAWAGLRLADVLGRIETGSWPGLASFYTRYRYPASRRKAMLADWRKAVSWVQKAKAGNGGERPVRNSPTSGLSTHRGAPRPLQSQQERSTAAEYQFLRDWHTALRALEQQRYTGRSAPGMRMVLRAIGEAGMKTGSRFVEFGTRSLDLASGLDHTTVAAHLRLLRDEEDPLVYLIENDRGLRGDLYELRVPEEVAEKVARTPWMGGKIHALRPVFRDLGLPAAFVYEALEHSKTPLSSFDLAGETRLARSTVYQALEVLAAFNMVERTRGQWRIVVTTSLAVLAEALGCLDTMSRRLAQHRVERANYRRALRVVTYLETVNPPSDWKSTAAEDESALDLLERLLGAKRLA